MPKKILFHIPHDGDQFPKELMRAVCVPFETFNTYHQKMRDFGVRHFIPPDLPAEVLSFEVSRLLCDVERFLDGEIMENYGMGFCYERAYDGTVIKECTDQIKHAALKYYTAHHCRLDAAVTNADTAILFIDLHSYSDDIVIHDTLEEIKPFPDICIGYDQPYLNEQAISVLHAEFKKRGFSTEINYPYSGSLVPNAVLKNMCDAKVYSVMIEANKRAYLSDGELNPQAIKVIRQVISIFCKQFLEDAF